MRNQESPPQHRHESLQRNRRRLAVLMLTVTLTALGIAIIGAICWFVVPPVNFGPSFTAQFTVLEGFFYPRQPAKTVAYQAACAATPFLLAVSFLAARRWTTLLSSAAIERLNWTGITLYLLLTLWCALPMFYCPNPPFWIVPPSWLLLPIDASPPFWVPARFFLLLVMAGVGWYFVAAPQTRLNANRVMAVLLAFWLWLIPSRFYAPGAINDQTIYTYHLNSLLDGMSQSVNGHHWLVDFPHLYGGYGELLAPLIRLFPHSLGVLITALAVPGVIGMLCLLFTARLLIHRPAILYLTGLSLFAVTYATTAEDLYYGYSAARFFLPALGLFLAVLYFRRPSAWSYALMTLLTAVAPIWNMDTGFVIWGGWLLTLVAAQGAARDFSAATRHCAIQVLTLAAAWCVLFLGLRLASGQWPQVGLLFYFQKMVVTDGYFCLRMIVPDMWVLILLLYLAGLTFAFAGHLRGRPEPAASATLMLSLLGIGLFSYFMGRSAPSNLVTVAYPVVLLAGRFCARAEVYLRRRTAPPQIRYLLLPSKFALFWWAFLFVAALPDLLANSRFVVTHWRDQTPLLADAGFVEQHTQPHENGVFFLSNQSGIFYYLSDTTRALKIPGTIELLRTPDMDALIEGIRQRHIQKLFVDQNFYSIEMYRLEFYQAIRDTISQNYQPVATSPTGHVVLYAPR